MKRNLLILLTAMLCNVTIGQNTLWSSDSESPVGWTAQDLDNDGSNWYNDQGGTTFGIDGKFFVSQSQSLSPNNAIISPIFLIPNGSDNITFEMRVASVSSTAYAEYYEVYIQEDGVGGMFDNLLFQETLTEGGTNSAKDIIASIPNSFAGKNVKIIVRHITNDESYLLVDDFAVKSDNSLSVEGNSFEGFSFFPNPSLDTMTFKTLEPITSIQIYNVLGQEVLSYNTFNIKNNQIDVASLYKGSYLMIIVIGNQSNTYKMIKK